MRVAHFCDCEPTRPDGVAASVGLTVALLRAAGHEVAHCYPGPPLGPRPARGAAVSAGGSRGRGRVGVGLAPPGGGGSVAVPSVAVPFRSVRLAAPWFRPAVGDVDVVHVHTTGPVGMAGYRLAATRRLPLVLTWHTDLLAYAEHFLEIPVGAAYCAVRLGLGWTVREHLELAVRGVRRRTRLLALGRALLGRASLVVAPSAKTAAGLAVFGALPPVRTVPTPVTLPAPAVAPAGLRAALDLPARAPVVLSVGRVTTEKNPALLLGAFAAVSAARPDARLVVVGVGRGRRRFVRRVRAAGLAGRVRLVPAMPRDRVADYYRMADVLAFASTTDTQSLVVAEAEAAGLPVVLADPALAIRAGGASARRVTCAPEPGALASALLRMLADGALRADVRAAGLAAARAYPPERHLALLTAAYAQALGVGPRLDRPGPR